MNCKFSTLHHLIYEVLLVVLHLHGAAARHGQRHATHLTLLRSEEHTSELQSRPHLVCRLLLEKTTRIIYRGLYLMVKRTPTLVIWLKGVRLSVHRVAEFPRTSVELM